MPMPPDVDAAFDTVTVAIADGLPFARRADERGQARNVTPTPLRGQQSDVVIDEAAHGPRRQD